MNRACLVLGCALAFAGCALAQDKDANLTNSLVSVRLSAKAEQVGVLTMVKGDAPSALVLLFPGDPGVMRPEVADGRITQNRLRGNPLARARHLLVKPGLATVLVDCPTNQGDSCRENYVLSKDRFEDVGKLLARVRQDLPSVKKVWVVGHSFGSHSSASVARYGEGVIDGAIHTAAVLYAQGDYRLLAAYDFSVARVPQLFIHHRNDPCPSTPYYRAEQVANRYKIPLVTITQASGMKGDRCQAFTEHGFMGAERELMQTISKAVEGGVDQFKR